MNWDLPVAMTVVDLSILIALVAIGTLAIKRGVFQFPSHSKTAVVLIFVGLATLTVLVVVDLVSLYVLPSLQLEAEAVRSLLRYKSNLNWIASFAAFVLIATGFLLVTRVIGRYETNLARSEAHYRSVVEDQSELIVRWNAEGIRTWGNDAYCAYFRYPEKK